MVRWDVAPALAAGIGLGHHPATGSCAQVQEPSWGGTVLVDGTPASSVTGTVVVGQTLPQDGTVLRSARPTRRCRVHHKSTRLAQQPAQRGPQA